ncbi:MAG: T9SS type A sorting domain-containing protein [Candidatus Latescibacteria bacterium]|nr:T9SS type A sorting domain-containing protein [Candidatus Latescibacterota bacterium]
MKPHSFLLPLYISGFCFILSVFTLHAEGRWTNYPQTNWIQRIAVDDEYVWAATSTGIVRWTKRDGTFTKFPNSQIKEALGENERYYVNPSYVIEVDTRGDMWINGMGLIKYDGVSWTRKSLGNINDLVFDSNNSLWIAATNGYLCGSLESDYSLTLIQEFPFEGRYIDVDCNDVIWVESDGNEDDGYAGGIVRYDGDTMIYYDTDDGLLSNNIKEIYVDRENNVWCGFDNGMSVFDGETWTSYENPELFGDLPVVDIVRDSKGIVWVSKVRKIYSFNGSEWIDRTPDDDILGVNTEFYNMRFYNIEIDDDDIMWCASYNGLLRFDGTSWENWQEPGGPHDGIESIYVDSKNRKWFSSTGGITCFDGEKWLQFSDTPQNNLRVFSDTEGPDGSHWTANGSGELYMLEDGEDSWTRIENMERCYFVMKDNDDNIWTTNNNGLSRYDGTKWEHFSLSDLKLKDSILCGAVDSQDRLWFGTVEEIIRYDGEHFTRYAPEDMRENYNYSLMIIDHNDVIWIGPQLYSFDGETWTDHRTVGGPERVYSLEVDNNNVVWAGGYNGGLWSYQNGVWHQHTEEIIPATRIYLAVAGTGNDMWFLCADGVIQYDGNEWKLLNRENVYFTKPLTHTLNRNCIAVDHDGVVWIGTYDGVISYTDDSVTFIENNSIIPKATPVITAHPNPFNPSTTITYSISDPSYVRIAIYNMAGQKIREIEADFMPAGTHTLSWDGRDTSGNIVSSGIYITRLEAGKHTATGRMVLVR